MKWYRIFMREGEICILRERHMTDYWIGRKIMRTGMLFCLKVTDEWESRLFLRLQAVTGKNLHKGESVVIFDEVQLYPKARQAVKHRLS